MAVPAVRTMAWQAGSASLHPLPHFGQAAPPALDAARSDPWLRQLATSLAVDKATLVEFRALLSRQGFKLETSRFFLDLAYAYRQLAIAHSLGDARLRALSLALFDACQQLDHRRRQMSEPSLAH